MLIFIRVLLSGSTKLINALQTFVFTPELGRLAHVCFLYLQSKYNLFSVLSTAHLRIVVKNAVFLKTQFIFSFSFQVL
jgi:hypothetical protein